jgi:hypothetical protein
LILSFQNLIFLTAPLRKEYWAISNFDEKYFCYANISNLQEVEQERQNFSVSVSFWETFP